MKTALLLLLCLPLAACLSFNDKHFDPLESALQARMPEITLEKEMAIGLGSGLFDLVDLMDSSDADLSKINHVRVAVYEAFPRAGQYRFSDAVFSESLRSQGSHLRWERIVRVRADSEQLWIFAGLNEAEQLLEALTVFVVQDNELVLINLDGGLNELLNYALASARQHRAT